MITLRSLGRKLEKLEASMQKDARRLSKLIRKVKRTAASETSTTAKKATKGIKNIQAAVPAASAKQKRKLSPEGRAKLSALMHERWAAKRAAAVPVASSPAPAPASDGH